MNSKKNIWLITPIFGSILFVFLYITATFYYPGGSQIDKYSTGFSLINNYWCNLLNDVAINGEINPAKPIAVAGLIILCLSLTNFWIIFPKYMNLRKPAKLLIQIPGVIAMAFALLLFSNIDHDLVTNLASMFGIIATIVTLFALYRKKWNTLFAFGLFNLLLVGLNAFVYYNKEIIIYLPIIQKISFASFLIWVFCTCICLYFRKKEIEKQAHIETIIDSNI